MATNERPAYIAGLRTLAGLLEAHPGIPLPSSGSVSPIYIPLLGEDGRRLNAVKALIGGEYEYTESGGHAFYETRAPGVLISLMIGALDVTFVTAAQDVPSCRIGYTCASRGWRPEYIHLHLASCPMSDSSAVHRQARIDKLSTAELRTLASLLAGSAPVVTDVALADADALRTVPVPVVTP